MRQTEATRLAALDDLRIMDSPPDAKFDAIVQTASLACGVPISIISLIGEDRQWFKAQLGLDGICETPRDWAFCAHTILGDDLLEVQDAWKDARFSDNPMVTGAPNIRFYAGVPLRLSDGHRIGTLCVSDRQPRCLDDKQRTMLLSLAKVASCALNSWNISRKQQETEKALVLKTQRLANLVEVTNVGTWEWDLSTGAVHVNNRFAKILGWALEAQRPFFADGVFAAVHMEDLAVLKENIQSVLEDRCESYDHEFRMRHSDGHVVWIRGHGTVMLRTQEGLPEWLSGTVEDIGRRKAQETALSKSQAFLDQTGRLAGVGGWELDLASEDIAWSIETFKIYGIEPGSTPSLEEVLSFYAPEARPAIKAAVARAAAGEGGWDLEVRFIQVDETKIWVRSVGSTVFTDGKPTRLIGAIQDVTDQVMQRQALQAASERVMLATETAGIGIWEWDPVAGRLAWDDRMYSLYGRPPTADVSTIEDWLQTLHPEDRARVGEAAHAAIDGRRPYDMEFRVIWEDGTVRHIHAMARVSGNSNGQITRLVGVDWDITKARLLEAERDERELELRIVNGQLESTARHLVKARDGADRASRAKSRFLAGMSHELRTPLNGILGYAQLLRLEGGLSDIQGHRVDAMLDAGTHLLEMISSVLELSEIETDHVELRPVEVDLAKIATVSLDLVRPRAEAKGLHLNCCADMDAPRSLVTDQMRLRQIILNLLGNAVKFTDAGRVELRLRAILSGTALRIEIADTGPGIKPEQRKRLFQDFERLQANVTGMVEGAGLGLALSSRLAALLGGRMGYDDNPGGGSIFWLELPLNFVAPAAIEAGRLACGTEARLLEPAAARASGQPPTDGETQGSREARSATRLCVLVVDDVAMNRDIARSFLRVAGHETVCACGGAEAVAAVRLGNIDVVLMDVRMPEVDGLEATRRIRLLDGTAGQVPIIGLTAQAFSEQILACTRAGMDGHISKPYTPDALREAIGLAAMLRYSERGSRPAELRQGAVASGELPVIDPEALARMAEYMTPTVIDSYLRSIVGRCESVLEALRNSGACAGNDMDLPEAIHTLAGSAGMFGFARLAASGVSLERALRGQSPMVSDLARTVVADIGSTLNELRRRPLSKAA